MVVGNLYYWTKDVQEGVTTVRNRNNLDKESRDPVIRRQVRLRHHVGVDDPDR